MTRIVLCTLVSFFATSLLDAQEGIVQGKIVAFKNIPIEKATITLKKSKTTVYSDSLGLFSIACKLKDKLTIKVDGFKIEKVKIKNLEYALFINLEYEGTQETLQKVAHNGHINKKQLIYATDYMDAEVFEDLGYTNALQMLSRKFPGVQIISNKILIRGPKSLTGNNAATIIIDGSMTGISTLEALHASDVKSIKVLKGTEAAIYGSLGAHGVVLVTTTGGRTD